MRARAGTSPVDEEPLDYLLGKSLRGHSKHRVADRAHSAGLGASVIAPRLAPRLSSRGRRRASAWAACGCGSPRPGGRRTSKGSRASLRGPRERVPSSSACRAAAQHSSRTIFVGMKVAGWRLFADELVGGHRTREVGRRCITWASLETAIGPRPVIGARERRVVEVDEGPGRAGPLSRRSGRVAPAAGRAGSAAGTNPARRSCPKRSSTRRGSPGAQGRRPSRLQMPTALLMSRLSWGAGLPSLGKRTSASEAKSARWSSTRSLPLEAGSHGPPAPPPSACDRARARAPRAGRGGLRGDAAPEAVGGPGDQRRGLLRRSHLVPGRASLPAA